MLTEKQNEIRDKVKEMLSEHFDSYVLIVETEINNPKDGELATFWAGCHQWHSASVAFSISGINGKVQSRNVKGNCFMRRLRALMGCECSGVVRDAFRARGWDAWSVDIKPSETRSPYHIQDDLFSWHMQEQWDLFIAHPPCTYLSSAGLHWMHHPKHKNRKQKQEEGYKFFMQCVEFAKSVPFATLENPKGALSSLYEKPTQYICPTEFGHKEPKMTGLWLFNLPNLQPTEFVEKETFGKTPSGSRSITWMDKCPIGENRQTYRSRTFQGIANAMADQWGSYIENEQLKGKLK